MQQSLFTNPDTEFYICGSPAMVAEVRAILKNSGIADEKVFFEQY
jgi:ferredoxin-NADP reductase